MISFIVQRIVWGHLCFRKDVMCHTWPVQTLLNLLLWPECVPVVHCVCHLQKQLSLFQDTHAIFIRWKIWKKSLFLLFCKIFIIFIMENITHTVLEQKHQPPLPFKIVSKCWPNRNIFFARQRIWALYHIC